MRKKKFKLPDPVKFAIRGLICVYFAGNIVGLITYITGTSSLTWLRFILSVPMAYVILVKSFEVVKHKWKKEVK